MRDRSLSAVAEIVRGRLEGADTAVAGVAVDSREVRRGYLFAALRGDRTDGHAFLGEAFARGAAGALVAREGVAPGPAVVVPDTQAALMRLGADEREAMTAHVVGVTGSNGKTSVKDLAAAVLSARFRTWASPRSFNTEVGVPLTLLRAPGDTEAVVCEMGSRGRGHVALLCQVARPSVGIVTNVGPAHLEMFGSLEGVADAKAELVEGLPEDGVAVLNADDPVVRGFGARTRARTIMFGTAADADVRGEDVTLDPMARPQFTLRAPGGTERVELAVPGEHMALNALAAAACGVALGLSVGECAAALKEARVSAWRMEVFEAASGVRVVNDAYNANPASVAAALKAVRWMTGRGRSIAVLGEMAELGAASDREHERIGELAARLGVHAVITVGPRARRIASGAMREGVEPDRVRACDTLDEAVEATRGLLRPGDVVLVKGSRIARLERLAEALR